MKSGATRPSARKLPSCTPIKLQIGPLALYAQLSNILRGKILSGNWKSGEEIPTLEEISEEYSVARVTTRQAIQILVQEGLLSSQRGRRTVVTYDQSTQDSQPLYTVIGSLDVNAPNFSIEIISKELISSLPARPFAQGSSLPQYMRIRKLDSEGGIPYGISDNYIAPNIYKKFPLGAESKIKIARLVIRHARNSFKAAYEKITVTSLDYESASYLQCPIDTSAGRTSRIFLNKANEIILFGTTTYRGDRFGIERDITSMVSPEK